MDDAKLIEELQEKVREAQDILRRRRDALAALMGKGGAGKHGRARGFRANSIPALAHAAIKAAKQPLSLDDLVVHLKKTNASLDARKISIALSRYVRLGQHFVFVDGKYGVK
ncbi:MAG: hypothetical protein DMG35_09815 [Acidobacteria bacterium]|nr:MAG: hypothetical protein DMG35_09815 [Acidobacteriota bacterium]